MRMGFCLRQGFIARENCISREDWLKLCIEVHLFWCEGCWNKIGFNMIQLSFDDNKGIHIR
jgi:hypothetical protein